MKLTPPRKNTFRVSVIVAAVGFVVYLATCFKVLNVAWLDLVGFLVVVAAFVLLSYSLTTRGL